MNRPSPTEIKALRQRYSPPKHIVKWVVVHCGREVFENQSPAICQAWINKNGLKNAFKKPLYEN